MRRRDARLPTWLARGIDRVERERKANVIARPMRQLMDTLAQGEVHIIDGRAVMRMPEVDEQFATRAQWCEIAPAIEGWRDCWKRLAPDISTYYLGVLAARLRDDKALTPRLVEQARVEFEQTIVRLADLRPGQIGSAIRTTEIAWEFEKLAAQQAAAVAPVNQGEAA